MIRALDTARAQGYDHSIWATMPEQHAVRLLEDDAIPGLPRAGSVFDGALRHRMLRDWLAIEERRPVRSAIKAALAGWA